MYIKSDWRTARHSDVHTLEPALIANSVTCEVASKPIPAKQTC